MTTAERQRKQRSRTSLAFQHGHQANGLCRLCSEPLLPGSIAHCAAHVLKARARSRKLKGVEPWRKGGPGRPPLVVTT